MFVSPFLIITSRSYWSSNSHLIPYFCYFFFFGYQDLIIILLTFLYFLLYFTLVLFCFLLTAFVHVFSFLLVFFSKFLSSISKFSIATISQPSYCSISSSLFYVDFFISPFLFPFNISLLILYSPFYLSFSRTFYFPFLAFLIPASLSLDISAEIQCEYPSYVVHYDLLLLPFFSPIPKTSVSYEIHYILQISKDI